MSAVPALSPASWLAAARAAKVAIPMLMSKGLVQEAVVLQRKAHTFEACAGTAQAVEEAHKQEEARRDPVHRAGP